MAWQDKLPRWLQRAVGTVDPLVRAASLWSGAGGMRMSAAMSFYGILSLAPLLLAIVGVLGWVMDRGTLEQGLLKQIGDVIGQQGAALLAEAMTRSAKSTTGIAASVAGFVVLLFGATGVFNELLQAFEQIWSQGRAAPAKAAGFRHTVSLRLRGVGYVLVFGFLLLVSLVVSTVLSMFSGWAGERLALEIMLRVVNETVAFVICTALFAGLMRLSSGPKPPLRFLLFGAFIGACLFTLGRQVMTFYLAGAAAVSAYGAAGSLIVLLMWIYFSSAVLLFSAGCARALAERKEVAPAAAPVPEAPQAEKQKPAATKAPRKLPASARLERDRRAWREVAAAARGEERPS